MLISLALRDVVLIDRLELAFGPGLTVLTGETGAGKSILLDGLGLALGARANSGLLAAGASEASAAAVFALPPGHPVRDLLAAHGLAGDDELRLRRVVTADGRSRAFINDQPVGVGLLRQAGADRSRSWVSTNSWASSTAWCNAHSSMVSESIRRLLARLLRRSKHGAPQVLHRRRRGKPRKRPEAMPHGSRMRRVS